MIKKKCLNCNFELIFRHKKKFCSNKCQIEYQYKTFIHFWKKGKVSGTKGIHTKFISGHIRKYLLDKYNNCCSICEWSKQHPITKKIPLEIDHIDGDSENNKEINLRLLCPNCHALTPHFKNLNKGNGRKWRADKYIKNI